MISSLTEKIALESFSKHSLINSAHITMDGDHSAKTFEQGANSALKENKITSGIHKSTNQTPAAGEKTQGYALSRPLAFWLTNLC